MLVGFVGQFKNPSWCKLCKTIGVGDRGAWGAIVLPFIKFGSVALKIRAAQNIFWAVFDSLKTFSIF